METDVHDFFEELVHLTVNALAFFNGEGSATLGAILEKLEKTTHQHLEEKKNLGVFLEK